MKDKLRTIRETQNQTMIWEMDEFGNLISGFGRYQKLPTQAKDEDDSIMENFAERLVEALK